MAERVVGTGSFGVVFQVSTSEVILNTAGVCLSCIGGKHSITCHAGEMFGDG